MVAAQYDRRMPTSLEIARGGVVRYRTIVIGKGPNRRVLRVAIVRKRGPRGGHTIAGPARPVKGT